MPDSIDLTKIDPQHIKTISSGDDSPIDLSAVKPDEVKVLKEVLPREKLNEFWSGVSGLAQGLTFGFSDEILGGARAAGGALTGEGNFSDLYPKYRDEQRAHQDAAKADNPKTFLGAEIGGSVGSSLAMPLKIPGTLAKIGAAAAQGGLAGAGLSEADLTTGTDAGRNKFITDTLSGAAVGGATQGALSVLGKGVDFLKPESLRNLAGTKALKAAGAMGKDLKVGEDRMFKNLNELHDAGRRLLDNKLVSTFSSLDDVAAKATALKQASGKEIGSVLGHVDDLVSSTEKLIDEDKLFSFLPKEGDLVKSGVQNIPSKEAAKQYLKENLQFNMQKIGERIQNEVIAPNVNNPVLKNEMKQLGSLADDFIEKGAANPSLSLKEAGQIKTSLGKKTRFESQTVPEQFKKQVYGVVQSEIADLVGKVSNIESALMKNVSPEDLAAVNLGRTDLAEAFSKANKDYGFAKKIEKMALARSGQAKSNRSISLTDTIAAAGGVAGGSLPAGLALGAVNKAIRQYGDSVAAVGADKLADVLSKAPNALGQFGSLIEKAAKEGPLALINTHYMLMKDPNYQRILMNFEPEKRGLSLPAQRQGLTLPSR